MPQRLTKENFINRAIKIHGDKYDYSKVEYINNKTKVCIICFEHGEFWISPDNILSGKGCKHCGIIRTKNKNKMSQEEFLSKAKEIHGLKYDYTYSNYINTDTKIKIICSIHGEFWQRPHHHLNKIGCPECGKCNLSENKLYEIIKKEFPDAIKQYNDIFLTENGYKQYIDIYIPSKKIGIEYQGKQHFKPVKHFGGETEFKKTYKRDLKKYNKSKENGIIILYFSYEKEIPENYIDKIYCDENKLLIKIKSL